MKNIQCLFIAIGLMISSGVTFAAPMLYTFEGIVSGFRSYHQSIDIDDFDVAIDETELEYVFEIDFDADNSSYSNSAGTWNYFYSDLLEGSIINGGNIYGDNHGFNWDRLSGSNIGQISSNLTDVRITSSESDTENWRVQDWEVGQMFRSTDLACFPGGAGGCAVYAFGSVQLSNIETVSVDEPNTIVLLALGLFMLGVQRMRR